MITLSAKQYIESQNIRVFPCAYRGYYNADETLVFDPEARATTEANFTNTFHKLSDNKESYVIAWVPDSATDIDGSGTLKCVIGGYYFEIYNHAMSNFFYPENGKLKPYYLCIKTESISLGTSKPDSTRTTKVLSSFAESTNYLDVTDTQGRYAFTGLLVSKTADESATASLAPFIATLNNTGSYDYKIAPTKLPITNLLDVGSGNYSMRMLEDDTEQGTNTTVADGNYSIALGLKTKATGEASTALGNNTTASGDGTFAAGNNTTASGVNAVALGDTTTASGINAVALGSNTKAEADNQVVIGVYNEKDNNQAFIIANGTADSNRSNKFTVSKNGDVNALGTLETKGSIKVTGNSNNALELGTPAAGSSGSIKVYGAGEAKEVFTVDNTGKTAISGATTITNATESTSTGTGALKVTGGAGIAKNLNVGGNAKVAKNLSISGELSVEKLTALKAGAAITGNVEITGKATSADKTITTDADTTLTTKSYVDDAKSAAISHTDTKLNALDFSNNEITTAKNPNGEYLQTVTQVDGKIAATKANFATTFNPADNLNAPTTLATDTHIRDVISNLWKDELVKDPNGGATKVSLQAIILDAIYPIGSIYMQYVDSEADPPDECPLATTLTDSKWELIEAGRFLRAASGKDYGKVGGSADAVLISHTHTYSTQNTTLTTGNGGAHFHNVTVLAKKVGTGDLTGFDGNSGEDTAGAIPYTTSRHEGHTHTVNLPAINYVTQNNVANGAIISTTGKDKNLPPYINVYMWKRVPNDL